MSTVLTSSVSSIDTIMSSSLLSSPQNSTSAANLSDSTLATTSEKNTASIKQKSLPSTLFHPLIVIFLFLRKVVLYSLHLFISNTPAAMDPKQPHKLSVNLHLNSTSFTDFVKFITTAEPPSFKLSKRLKPRLEKKILVLDLDETLIHSSAHSSKGFDQMIEVFVDKLPRLYYVFKRPNVDYFLKKVSEWYEVVIFTASVPEYANPVINLLDIDHTLISRRFYRQSCSNHGSGYIKDLKQIDKDLSKLILVDNAAISFYKNLNNGIPITSWYNDNAKDQCLLDLLPVLDSLRFVSDTRSLLQFRGE